MSLSKDFCVFSLILLVIINPSQNLSFIIRRHRPSIRSFAFIRTGRAIFPNPHFRHYTSRHLFLSHPHENYYLFHLWPTYHLAETQHPNLTTRGTRKLHYNLTKFLECFRHADLAIKEVRQFEDVLTHSRQQQQDDDGMAKKKMKRALHLRGQIRFAKGG